MRWTVALQAEGDREVLLEEVVELADAVAAHEGVASGMGTHSYGALVVVEADSSDKAIEQAVAVFTEAATNARLPDWPITNVETMADEQDMDWYQEVPEGRGLHDEDTG